MKRFVFALLVPVLTAQNAWGPDEVRSTNHPYTLPAAVTLRVQASLVEVGVVVRDAHGNVVEGLERKDFRIFDGGKERDISAFSVETAAKAGLGSRHQKNSPAAAPSIAARSVILFFDDNSISPGDLGRTKLAARRFVNEALDPGDLVSIATASSTHTIDFTSDREKVLETIAKLTSHPRIDENGLLPCPRITPYQAYLIVNKDPVAEAAALDEAYVCVNGPPVPSPMPPATRATFRATVEPQAESTWQQARIAGADTLDAIGDALGRLTNAPGSRMLILASSGFLATTLEAQQDRIIDRALKANIVIHSLDAKGLYSETGRPGASVRGGGLPLSTFIFEQTSAGGRLMETGAAMANLAESTGGLYLHDNNDLDAGLRSLVPETAYRLGFSPDNIKDDGKYHTLKVRLNDAGLNHVLARRGYFAPAVSTSAPVKMRNLDRAASDTNIVSELPVRFVSEAAPNAIRVTLVVDVKQLKKIEKLVFIAALFDENGNFVAGKEGELNLAMKDATYAHFSETGISTRVTIPIAPGTYRLREVVEDSAGKQTASTQAVEIR